MIITRRTASDGVTVMLAGGIGGGAINVLNNSGIEVIRGCSGDAGEVVKRAGYRGAADLTSIHAATINPTYKNFICRHDQSLYTDHVCILLQLARKLINYLKTGCSYSFFLVLRPSASQIGQKLRRLVATNTAETARRINARVPVIT